MHALGQALAECHDPVNTRVERQGGKAAVAGDAISCSAMMVVPYTDSDMDNACVASVAFADHEPSAMPSAYSSSAAVAHQALADSKESDCNLSTRMPTTCCECIHCGFASSLCVQCSAAEFSRQHLPDLTRYIRAFVPEERPSRPKSSGSNPCIILVESPARALNTK